MDWTAFVRGLAMSTMLIVAIGAQNAFVLSHGLRREHVLPIVLTCAFSDAVLVTAGVAGAGALLARHRGLLVTMSWAGAVYLTAFGLRALRRALRSASVNALGSNAGRSSLRAALLTTLALTYLNPHVYLDTVIVLGAMGAREHGTARIAFVFGTMTVSFAWFFALGFGARLLAPLFARPVSWRVLDGLIAAVALMLAVSLVA